MLFADEDTGRNHGYGNHVWTLRTELPEVPQAIVEFAAEFYGCDEDEAENLVNPDNIVGSAGAWDDPQFVSEVYQFCGEPTGFRTPDGAVVLDRESVELEYRVEEGEE